MPKTMGEWGRLGSNVWLRPRFEPTISSLLNRYAADYAAADPPTWVLLNVTKELEDLKEGFGSKN